MPRIRLLALPFAVLAISLLSTAAVAIQLNRSVLQQDRERFEAASSNLQAAIATRLDTYIATLRAGAGLIAGEANPTAAEFAAFVDRLGLQHHYPGIQGIGYTAKIPASALARVTTERRQAGQAEFHVWPEHPRDEYHAILYLEPLDRRNAAALGYDMFTDATRREAMERARDTGEAAASGLVTLVQEIDEEKQPGFLIYVPVYDGVVVPDSVAARRERLRGFVYSPFRAGDLFAGILGNYPYARAGFELHDGPQTEGTLVHRTGDRGEPRFTTARVIDVAGRRWTATLFSTTGLDTSSSLAFVPWVAWGGGLISLLLAGLAVTQAHARARAEDSEAAAAGASASLQRQAETLSIINHTGVQLAGELDLDRLVQAVTDAATRLTGAQFGAFFYNKVNGAGESYTLYTLSGVPREAFARFPMPRNTALFGPTFRGEGIIRSADVTTDPRYGLSEPHLGMPPGHLPVRSYLAVPVKSRSGDVLGGLFFGHAATGVFTEQSEQLVGGIAAQTAIAIDNARLYGRVQQLLGSERAARTEAERVSRMKDEFLAVLSHELRTPLNAVMGWAHLLHTGTLPDGKRAHAVESILRNAQAQSRLIEDLLDMSRIISGRLSLELSTVDLREVVEAAVNAVRPSAAAKRVNVSTHGGEHPAPVHGDAGRLQQIVWNLATNAIKFTPSGGEVRVTLTTVRDELELAVHDTGAGIEPEFVRHVFDRFRQADASFARGHGGLGLGLSIVRSLVEMHGGRVAAASEGRGRGATFTVVLPRATSTVAAGDAPAAAGSHASDMDRGLLAGLSILVVDDDKDGRDLAVEVLRQQGATVAEAGSGSEALALLMNRAGVVDLIISDVGMPGMDGYEFIARVRERISSLRDVPAIALTAYAGSDDRLRTLAAGYQQHLAKPFSPTALVSACARLRATPRSTD